MPDPHPEDILDQAIDAMGAVTDLLCSIERGNLHMLDPGEFWALLVLLRERLKLAQAGFDARHKPR